MARYFLLPPWHLGHNRGRLIVCEIYAFGVLVRDFLFVHLIRGGEAARAWSQGQRRVGIEIAFSREGRRIIRMSNASLR
jgi:hypothetical protein